MDTYSSNNLHWQGLYKYTIESLFTSFSSVTLKCTKEILTIFFNDSPENNYPVFESVIHLINLMPILYNKLQITNKNIIDYTSFFQKIEKHLDINKPYGESLLNSYVISIAKWCEILISRKSYMLYFIFYIIYDFL